MKTKSSLTMTIVAATLIVSLSGCSNMTTRNKIPQLARVMAQSLVQC